MRTEWTHDRRVPWPVMASSLWLRAGIVSVGVAALALVLLFTGEGSAFLAIGWAVAGATFAVFALRRAWAVLGEEESEPEPERQGAPFTVAPPPRQRAALLGR